jgi:NAD(P)-dependent dehydrogenase (short-subunit alcohol dehydrogenase family)
MSVRSTWLVTGAGGGLCRELTEQLLARGDRVAAALRRPRRLEGLAARYRRRLWVRGMEATDIAQIREVVDAAFAELGRIDVVVSGATYDVVGAAEELTDEQVEAQLRTNLTGAIQLARAVVPHLRAQGGGRIVQVSGMGGQVAFPGLSVHHATKWGIEGFYESFAAEVAPFGIRTILVEPGFALAGVSSSAEAAAPAAAYDGNPARVVHGHPPEAMRGDLGKMARMTIIAADADEPPKRLLLGSDAYGMVRSALTTRLALVDSQRELARSADVDRPGAAATVVTSAGRVDAGC